MVVVPRSLEAGRTSSGLLGILLILFTQTKISEQDGSGWHNDSNLKGLGWLKNLTWKFQDDKMNLTWNVNICAKKRKRNKEKGKFIKIIKTNIESTLIINIIPMYEFQNFNVFSLW